MTAAAAREYLNALMDSSNPQIRQIAEQMKSLHEKKLWHQLTTALENFVNLPIWQNTKEEKIMTGLYERFIRDFETKLNQLKLVKICLAISYHLNDEQKFKFLTHLSEKIHADAEKEAHSLVLSELANFQLSTMKQVEESKVVADKVGAVLEKITGADPSVYSSYYRYLTEYYKIKVAPTDFYRNALMFLVYTPLETIPLDRQQTLAFDMGIAALVATDIHNFGELLAHPILKSLNGSNREWLVHFLVAFNSGDMKKFEQFLVSHQSQIQSQGGILKDSIVLLREKVALLALMELVFNKQSDERTLPFTAIAEATNLHVDAVEIMVMKALSLKLVRGTIDEVHHTVTITWVQPRVLDITQVTKMRDRVQLWIDRTNQTLSFVEGTTAPELLA